MPNPTVAGNNGGRAQGETVSMSLGLRAVVSRMWRGAAVIGCPVRTTGLEHYWIARPHDIGGELF